MEDFVTLDELEEDNDEAHGESDNIGTWSDQYLEIKVNTCTCNVLQHQLFLKKVIFLHGCEDDVFNQQKGVWN